MCHIPKGELEFDASITGAHVVERFSTSLAGVKFSILDAKNMAPGQKPMITFGLTDKADKPLEASKMGRLALLLAGSTNQYADINTYISESALGATGSNGKYTYQFTAPIPANATGSWAVSVEGYMNAKLLPGTTEERDVRDAGKNVVTYFSLSGAAAVPRRQVVAVEKCNACHYSLNLHGSNRNDTQNCVICHNVTFTDTSRPPATGPGEALNFKEFIHRIHQGPNNTRDISIYNGDGVATSFNGVRYPKSTSDCGACHVNGSEMPPLAENLAPATDPRGYFNPSPPVTGACISCHATTPAAAHADLNTSPTYGESCSICHAQGAPVAVDKAHAQ
jgi:OmcA/MtrC family decaheme c-type cytochrome